MIFYFTTSNLIGSKLIRWGTDSEWSHFAFGTRNDPYSIVVESRLFHGVKPSWQKHFLERNQRVEMLYREESIEVVSKHYNRIVDTLGEKPYDWKAVSYWSGVALAQKLGFHKISRNQWADRNAFYCTEVLKALEPYFQDLGVDTWILKDEFLTPDKANFWLQTTGLFKRQVLK